ncbi:MAG: precorrin-2 C(20)-methyltransferase [Desulfovibrio sp.]|jgi:precorrin-2/cobalt-factor-2 C20-methyltransferase|nr:precorrin-2 C(20)-methyltransferase [Desulfovibrio sp.]
MSVKTSKTPGNEALSWPPRAPLANGGDGREQGRNSASGVLYGIGVGPGSPDLLTLRAVAALRSARVVLAAASPGNEYSLALSIAAPHLPEDAEILRLNFPMTRDARILEQAWSDNARQVLEVLHSGRDAAFLTLGDPLIYSTFGYLLHTLQTLEPGVTARVIPGITSYQEAAARSRTVLCQGGENLLIVSGINDADRLAQAMRLADSAVILKAYRNFSTISEVLRANGRSGHSLFASRLGLDNEILLRGLENVPENPHYLSLILAPPDRSGSE